MPPKYEVEQRVSPRRWRTIDITFSASSKEEALRTAAFIFDEQPINLRAKQVR